MAREVGDGVVLNDVLRSWWATRHWQQLGVLLVRLHFESSWTFTSPF